MKRRLKILDKTNLDKSGIKLQLTLRLKVNVSYRNGIAGSTKTICIHKDFIEAPFNFTRSENIGNMYYFQNSHFINYIAIGIRKDSIRHNTKNVLASKDTHNHDVITEYAKQFVDEDQAYLVEYAYNQFNVNDVCYVTPTCFSIIILDPTGRHRKIRSLLNE